MGGKVLRSQSSIQTTKPNLVSCVFLVALGFFLIDHVKLLHYNYSIHQLNRIILKFFIAWARMATCSVCCSETCLYEKCAFNNTDGSRLLKKLLCLSATFAFSCFNSQEHLVTSMWQMQNIESCHVFLVCGRVRLFLIKSIKSTMQPKTFFLTLSLSAVWLVSPSLTQDSGQSVSFLQRTADMYQQAFLNIKA